jgi:hypothetical protein
MADTYKEDVLKALREQVLLLREIRDLLKPKKAPPRNLPPPPSPADDPTLPKKKLVFNEAINKWQWENDK